MNPWWYWRLENLEAGLAKCKDPVVWRAKKRFIGINREALADLHDVTEQIIIETYDISMIMQAC